MNNAIPSEIRNELDEIKNDVRSIKDTVKELHEMLKRGSTKPGKLVHRNTLDWSDPTPDELMLYSSHAFGVSSKPSADDDNIAPDAVVKPVDFSEYA
jgi:hypothetical protein